MQTIYFPFRIGLIIVEIIHAAEPSIAMSQKLSLKAEYSTVHDISIVIVGDQPVLTFTAFFARFTRGWRGCIS